MFIYIRQDVSCINSSSSRTLEFCFTINWNMPVDPYTLSLANKRRICCVSSTTMYIYNIRSPTSGN